MPQNPIYSFKQLETISKYEAIITNLTTMTAILFILVTIDVLLAFSFSSFNQTQHHHTKNQKMLNLYQWRL